MNLVILKGNIGNDPVIKSFEWGKTASFSLATTESYLNKKKERITETDWHNISFTGAVCDVIEKHLHKGEQVIITGRIKYRSYEDKQGVTKYITEIKADTFEFCGGSKKESKPDNNEGQFQKNGKISQDSMSDISELPGATDDMPF